MHLRKQLSERDHRIQDLEAEAVGMRKGCEAEVGRGGGMDGGMGAAAADALHFMAKEQRGAPPTSKLQPVESKCWRYPRKPGQFEADYSALSPLSSAEEHTASPYLLPTCCLLPTYLPLACLPACLLWLPARLPAHLIPCLLVHLPLCLPAGLSACLPACLPAHLLTNLPALLPACLPTCLPAVCLPACLPAYLPHRLPACLLAACLPGR